MKNSILALLAAFALLTAIAIAPAFRSNKLSEAPPSAYARCYGKSPCNACSTCAMCGHCGAGGSCGKCIKPKKSADNSYGSSQNTPKKNSSVSKGQCQATTKKGTRCSRNSKSGGYCWQHGG